MGRFASNHSDEAIYLRYVWTAIKVFLTAALITVALAFYFSARSSDLTVFGIIGFLLGMTVLLWAPSVGASPWGAAAICVLVALLCALLTYDGTVNGFGLPDDCSARKKLLCHAMNALYRIVGPAGITGIGITTSLSLLWAARTFIGEARRRRSE